jgi:hypothetical protein
MKVKILHNKITKLINIFLFSTFVFASGGYDHGKSAGKGLLDISLTLNPFNYFKNGQSYIILGYGLTSRIDFQFYYSYSHKEDDNYYAGLLYQFYKKNNLDLSTAIGLRKYTNKNTTHLFSPQLLYNYKLSNKLAIGGSFVNLVKKNQINKSLGVAKDIFIILNILENKKYKIDITAGVFNPILWEPSKSDWYPTYSVDIKIK